ncbi:hypothetical protein I4U23_030703 [Adineta vaga]|nr:hypothetical protein I4U23_030703 [Adineta vaga]
MINKLTVLCILVSLPMSMTLNCYTCSGLISTACNDPFNATGSGVTQTGQNNNNTYCQKDAFLGIITRSGSTSCIATNSTSLSTTACCQTDLCNAAYSHYQVSFLMLIGFIAALTRIY